MSCCGGNCGCGSGCKCGSSCTGCGGKYSDPSFTEMTTTEILIVGVAPAKMLLEGSEMNYGAENCSGCGVNFSCNPCNGWK